jgi:hypothetical protein
MLSCCCAALFLFVFVTASSYLVLCHDFGKTPEGKGRRCLTYCPFVSDSYALASIVQIRAGLSRIMPSRSLKPGRCSALRSPKKKKAQTRSQEGRNAQRSDMPSYPSSTARHLHIPPPAITVVSKPCHYESELTPIK